MRRFPVDALPAAAGATLLLDEPSSKHLLVVLRAKPGTQVLLFDGKGHEAAATVTSKADGIAELTLDEDRRAQPIAPELHLVMAIVKGQAMDRAVRMATECGASHIHPVLVRHCVAKGTKIDRWERIASSSAQQCGRADTPLVSPVRTLFEAIAALPAGIDLRIAAPGSAPAKPASGAAAVAIGPEGGFTPDEVLRVINAGGTPIGLGRHILRADTAAAVALALTAPNAGPGGSEPLPS